MRHCRRATLRELARARGSASVLLAVSLLTAGQLEAAPELVAGTALVSSRTTPSKLASALAATSLSSTEVALYCELMPRVLAWARAHTELWPPADLGLPPDLEPGSFRASLSRLRLLTVWRDAGRPLTAEAYLALRIKVSLGLRLARSLLATTTQVARLGPQLDALTADPERDTTLNPTRRARIVELSILLPFARAWSDVNRASIKANEARLRGLEALMRRLPSADRVEDARRRPGRIEAVAWRDDTGAFAALMNAGERALPVSVGAKAPPPHRHAGHAQRPRAPFDSHRDRGPGAAHEHAHDHEGAEHGHNHDGAQEHDENPERKHGGAESHDHSEAEEHEHEHEHEHGPGPKPDQARDPRSAPPSWHRAFRSLTLPARTVVTVPLSSAVGDLLVFHDAPPRLFNAERGQGLEGLLSQAPFQRRPPRRPIVLRGSDCVLRMPGRPTDALSIRALPWPFPAWLRLAPESGQTLLTGLGIEQREGLAARLEDRWHGRLSGLARELRKRPGQALVVCEHPRTLSLKVDTGAAPARGHLRLRLLGGAVYGQDGRYQLRRPRALELLVYEPDMQLAVAPPSGQD